VGFDKTIGRRAEEGVNRVLYARHVVDSALSALFVDLLCHGFKPSSPDKRRDGRSISLWARFEFAHHNLAPGRLGPEDLIDLGRSDHLRSLRMPCIGALVIVSVESKDSLEATIAIPESPDLTRHQALCHRIEDTLEYTKPKTGLKGATIQRELTQSTIQ
jgi:hypothetical protein